MGEQESSKWEGEITEELTLTPQQVWSLLADFCSVHKWCSHIDNSYIVEGVKNEPGVIRCCESSHFPGGGLQWIKEKLLMMDPSSMCLSYQIIDNNAGFNYYVATHQLFPIDGGDGGCCRCKFLWSFIADPVQGFSLHGLLEFFSAIAQSMVKNMEDALSQDQDLITPSIAL